MNGYRRALRKKGKVRIVDSVNDTEASVDLPKRIGKSFY